ncbi:MAG: TRL-like family protein [Paludibacter sp.]|nr:TRL-like family protein [Bacteroidales bacterium]MCM1069462.1 TRL-like family protein [Prevotella sp.]MCM1353836.1 TRL-like family protein [Bacteroides sp.]MCM1442764.1 TRL-like family protein [Muribaculum sp.]MCM1481872.1 TRL-like family protein [Paludibacter sp.]
MKKSRMMLIGALCALVMTSCGTTGMVGTIFTGYTEPAMVTSNSLGRKCGTAKTVSVLGIVAVGDAGVQQAAMMGGITKISHVDKKVVSVLGLFTVNKYYVYGE